jgi:hypothetical protein
MTIKNCAKSQVHLFRKKISQGLRLLFQLEMIISLCLCKEKEGETTQMGDSFFVALINVDLSKSNYIDKTKT